MGELRKHYFQGFLSKKFHLEHDEEKANQLTGLIYMISGVLAPLIGMLLDKARHNLENFQNGTSIFKLLAYITVGAQHQHGAGGSVPHLLQLLPPDLHQPDPLPRHGDDGGGL